MNSSGVFCCNKSNPQNNVLIKNTRIFKQLIYAQQKLTQIALIYNVKILSKQKFTKGEQKIYDKE